MAVWFMHSKMYEIEALSSGFHLFFTVSVFSYVTSFLIIHNSMTYMFDVKD